jgi:Zn finger protein HypA/HybF involved in hydrogenase expression
VAGLKAAGAMPRSKSDPAAQPPTQALSVCPLCHAELTVLRIVPGRAGIEYWTLRCPRCGGIHLDTVEGATPA